MEAQPNHENKQLSLEEAIRRYVKPGTHLHLAGGIGGPSAAICEIIRQFHGSNPGFELTQSTLTGHAINLIHCNLVKKLIFSACIEIAASAHPSKTVQKAYALGKIEFENWSLLALQQMLMAGALGLGFIPTRSIVGSSMASENRASFQEIDDPFASGEKIGVLRSINPDLSVVHGCVADAEGNTILAIPYGDDIWGSLASKRGVLVTVEKIVSSDFIRKHSSLVKIPSSAVVAVCEAPFGIHPYSLAKPEMDALDSYDSDEAFLADLHEASSDPQKLDDWINEWVLECKSHEYYLKKLGGSRITHLKKTAIGETSNESCRGETRASDLSPGYTGDEMFIIAAAREIIDSVLKSNYKTMLVGAGSPGIMATLAYYLLTTRGYRIDLITGNGQFGYIPVHGASSTQTVAGIKSAKMLTDTITTHGVFVGGKNSTCLSVLGAGQIDKYGNINSSRTWDGSFLVGTGGSNDAANAREVILALKQSKERFVETLAYITARGQRVSKVISTMGVFEKASESTELCLVACFPDPKEESMGHRVESVKKHCGWPLRTVEEVRLLPEPAEDELELLRSILSSHVT